MRQQSAPEFLLVGNGAYLNRGCEAIVRGTVEILKRRFGAGSAFTVASYGGGEVIAEQAARESDPAISHVALLPLRRSARGLCALLANRLRCHWAFYKLQHMNIPKRPFAAALEIGGDNYSLEYGRPERFLAMDRHLLRRGLPLVLWGASVGPFDSQPDYARKMFSHLRNFHGIFARESETMSYLGRHGAGSRVSVVVDPAFVMPAVAPARGSLGFEMSTGLIGMNLSPLLGRFVGLGADDWLRCCGASVARVATVCRQDVLLVPHVYSPSPANDDFRFLAAVAKVASDATERRIWCLQAQLSAAEIKWLIATCCRVFAGARTHSTIAAISSAVPALTFAYSIKGHAIPRDIFGSDDFSISASDFAPNLVAACMRKLIENAESVRLLLESRRPDLSERAHAAANKLAEIVRDSAPHGTGTAIGC